MDKNMIHIDDLVRQRLGGGEENERAGAWLNMRDLLDQKMPVTPKAGGYNWRRMLGLATGLVLLATATIGGYHVVSSTSFRADGNGGNSSDGGKMLSSAKPEFVPNKSKSADCTTSPNTIAPNGTQTPASATSTTLLASNDAGDIGSQPEYYHTASGAAPVTHYPNQQANKQNELASVINDKDNTNSNNSHNNSLATTSGHQSTPANQPLASNGRSASTPSAAGTPAPKQRTANNNAQSNNGRELASAGTTNIKTNMKPAIAKQDILKDTFKQLQVVQRFIVNPLTRSSRIVTDTVSFGKVAKDRIARVNNNTVDEDVMPGALANSKAFASNADADEALMKAGIKDNIVPLSSYKVRSKRTSAWDTRSFNEVVRDIKFNMSQVKFYPGIMAGYNQMSVDNTPFRGFHLGITGLFTFGEQWGLMTDLKYFNRSNGSYVVHDNYAKPVGASTISRVERFFKFSAMQSIEMPLAIRYTANRLNIFAGPNLVYNFGLNPEEAIYTFDPEPEPPYQMQTSPSIFLDDFNARFSVGGLLGLSYELNPMFQLDLRATKNFWDNAKGSTAQNASQLLYRAPTFQVSLGYRFSQKQRIPRAK